MIEYNVVKYCSFCKKRFVVDKSKRRQYLCDKCEEKKAKEPEESEESE